MNFIKSLKAFCGVFIIKSKNRQILFTMKKTWKILLIIVGCFSVLTAGGSIYYAAVTKDAVLDENKLLLSDDKIELFDAQGESVKNAAAFSSRETFRLDSLAPKAKYAFVDTEDKGFYSHRGFDFKRMAKATLKNAKARSFKEGASTISQQLIKNTHLSQEKTIKRKLKEFKLTRALEKRYSKDEILEKYLNTIYFGHSCFGLRSAADFYFGKQPEDLDLADSAVLAGLIKSPNNYSPFKHPENCARRKKLVLSAMRARGHIDETEESEALKKPLPDAPTSQSLDRSYFNRVFDELEELSDRYDFTLGGNIRIYTYLDPRLQEYLESLGNLSETDKTYSVLDSKTHGFKAYYSTVGEIKRLPGSLIKPLLVYAPALEENLISPATPILDERTNFAGYEPKNFDGSYSGYLSVRECLSKSVNVPAVKILNSMGVAKSAEYMKKMGLAISEEDYSLALALGGMKEGFTLNGLLDAYSTFSCGGEYAEGGFIREVLIDGRPAYHKTERKTRVFSEETAYLVNDMLKTAAKTGTAKKLRSLPFPVAAKTGTSGTEKGNSDAYALSYTTSDCVGVWLGNADNALTDITGGGLPANVLLKINEYLHRNSLPEDFPRPAGIEKAELDKAEYYATHNMILADENAPVNSRFSELFKKSAFPAARSDKYSHPATSAPTLKYEDGKVVIRLKAGAPEEYEYLIDRFDSVTHNTVYSGKFTDTFSDDKLENGKTYVYTITPVYKGTKGKSISLPAVTTKNAEGDLRPVVPDTPPEIVGKDWWNY